MEYWDIYDKDRNKTGRVMRRNDWNMQAGDYHLSVLGIIMRPDGRILITKRADNKVWAPGWWEVPGGGVNTGEESRPAVLRELKEETGLDLSNAESELVYTYSRENPEEGDNYHVDVYRFMLDFEESDVNVQEEEISDFRIASPDEIAEIAKEGLFLHYDTIKHTFYLK